MTEEAIQKRMAEMQLRGYAHAKRGYSLIELVESMGMTDREWLTIRRRGAGSLGLLQTEIAEITEHFRKKKDG